MMLIVVERVVSTGLGGSVDSGGLFGAGECMVEACGTADGLERRSVYNEHTYTLLGT